MNETQCISHKRESDLDVKDADEYKEPKEVDDH